MHRFRLAFAGALVFAAFEVGAAIPGEGLAALPIQSCLGELHRLSDAEGHSESHNFDLNKRCPDLARQLAASLRDGDAGSIEIDATSIQGLRRSGGQATRQGFLAMQRGAAVDALEQRAGPEEIEVLGIGVVALPEVPS